MTENTSEGTIGLSGAVSIALGGMIGGGIFAVLGVVAQISRGAAWFAFLLAGMVALCAGYSFLKLNEWTAGQGGAVTFVQYFVGNTTLAGITGWTLLLGYVGSMAMYAYAFGSFTVGLLALPEFVYGLTVQALVSVGAVAAFTGLNLLGAQATGAAENVLVGGKIAILLAFGLGGLYFGFRHEQLELGMGRLRSFGPVMAGAISFVAFQGWQLLFYDQGSLKNTDTTLRRAVFIAIPAAILLYVIVAVTTVSLAPLEVIRTHPERALAVAADPVIPYGFALVSVAALLSTGSAINATLFSAGHFAEGMISEDLLRDRIGSPERSGIPPRTLGILGTATAVFAAYGHLEAITAFASLTFILVFGAMGVLAFRERDRQDVNPVIPAVAAGGSLLFFVLMFIHLFRAERPTFYSVCVLAASMVTVELLYFERSLLKEEAARIERLIAGRAGEDSG